MTAPSTSLPTSRRGIKTVFLAPMAKIIRHSPVPVLVLPG